MKKKVLICILGVLCVLTAGLTACVGHTHSYVDEVINPTCTVDGHTTHTCECGDVYVDTYVNKLGHVYDKEVCDSKFLAIAGDCFTKSTYYKSCICGEKGTDTFIGDFLHTYDQEIKTEEYLATVGDCIKKSTYYKSCTCGEKGTETFDGNFSAHNVENNACTFCYKTESEGLKYELSEDKTYYVLKSVGTCTDPNVIIPAEHGGLPVKNIAEYAFRNCEFLTSVYVPSSVTSIDRYAFGGCKNLMHVNIPDSMETVGWRAFASSENLQYNVKDDLYYLGNSTNPYFYLAKVKNKEVETVEIDKNCKIIGEEAFRDCQNLESVTIPDGVKSICEYAFYNCKKLMSLTIPNSVENICSEAISACISLESVTMGDGVKHIASYAFNGCTALKTVTLNNSLTSVGGNAFYNCVSLKYNKKGDLKYLGNSTNPYMYLAGTETKEMETIEIDENCKIIGQYALKSLRKLTSITLPASVISITEEAIYDCSNLKSINVDKNNTVFQSIDGNLYSKDGKRLIKYATGKTETSFTVPNGVTSIDSHALEYCEKLKRIEISDSVERIGEETFYNCNQLESIKLGAGVSSIGERSFLECRSLTNIEVSANNSVYTSIDGNLYSKDGKTLIHYLIGKTETSFTIPKGVTSIYYEAFRGNYYLESVEIPDSVTIIDSRAFASCYVLERITIGNGDTIIRAEAFENSENLKYVTIGDGDVSIYEDAFEDCENLTSVKIGNGDVNIGDDAFYGCDSLKTITIGNGATSIGESAFSNCSDLETVTIGNGKSIDDYAFYECYNLKSITFGSGLKSIGESAFYGCSSLEEVHYLGSKSEWESIDIDYDNYDLLDAELYYDSLDDEQD